MLLLLLVIQYSFGIVRWMLRILCQNLHRNVSTIIGRRRDTHHIFACGRSTSLWKGALEGIAMLVSLSFFFGGHFEKKAFLLGVL